MAEGTDGQQDYNCFAYIDILGFRNLVDSDPTKVKQIFNIVANLEAWKNKQSIVFIVFSDTIIFYNKYLIPSKDFLNYIIFYIKELSLQLAEINIFITSSIRIGQFIHERIETKNQDYFDKFYGKALIDAYDDDKNILNCTGLFIHITISNEIINPENCLIEFSPDYHFYILTDHSQNIPGAFGWAETPDSTSWKETIETSNLPKKGWVDGIRKRELDFLKKIYKHSQVKSQPNPRIRSKYINAWAMYEKKLPENIIKEIIS